MERNTHHAQTFDRRIPPSSKTQTHHARTKSPAHTHLSQANTEEVQLDTLFAEEQNRFVGMR